MSTFFAYLLASPVIIGRFILSKPGLIVLVVAVIMVLSLLRQCNQVKRANIPEYQENAPTQVIASKVLKTYSRLYYTSYGDYTQEGDTEGERIFRLSRYYWYDDNEWVLVERPDNPLPLDEKYYGRIRIYDNTN